MSVLFRKTSAAYTQGTFLTPRFAVISLFVTHFFGALGLLYSPTRPYFELATPLNLLVTAVFLFSFHKEWNISFIKFALVCAISGFVVEVAGVQTGLIFGTYTYGPTLGFKLWGVPLIIGINWLILIYSTGIMVRQISRYWWLNSLLGGAMMIVLDFFIEPVAVALDFWQWESGKIPIHNFLGWLATAFLLQAVFHLSKFDKQNPLAKYVFYVQLIFFIFLRISV